MVSKTCYRAAVRRIVMRSFALGIGACLLALSSDVQAIAQPLDQRAFAAEMAKAIKAEAREARVEIVTSEELRVRTKEGGDFTVFLTNAYSEYKRDPNAIPTIARRFVASSPKAPREATGLDRTRVVPVVKDQAWLKDYEKVQGAAAGKPIPALSEELNDELVIVYAEDTPTRTRYLGANEFAAIGVARAELRAFATKNLGSVLPKINLISGAPVQSLTAGGDYDASLLLFDHIWSSGQIKVNGDIIVAIPARDMLLITGSRDTQGMAGLRAMAAKYVKERPHRLTDKLFLYRQGRFYPLPAAP